ncbi:hypothetical protein BGZ54_004057, partial [Gamsiella multidivaricata]
MKITIILSVLAAATLVSAGKFHSLKHGKSNIINNGFIIEYNDGVKHSDAHDALKSRN